MLICDIFVLLCYTIKLTKCSRIEGLELNIKMCTFDGASAEQSPRLFINAYSWSNLHSHACKLELSWKKVN